MSYTLVKVVIRAHVVQRSTRMSLVQLPFPLVAQMDLVPPDSVLAQGLEGEGLALLAATVLAAVLVPSSTSLRRQHPQHHSRRGIELIFMPVVIRLPPKDLLTVRDSH